MKCKYCSYPRAKYKEQKTEILSKKQSVRQRKKLPRRKRSSIKSTKTDKPKPRTNYKIICPKCKKEYVGEEIFEINRKES